MTFKQALLRYLKRTANPLDWHTKKGEVLVNSFNIHQLKGIGINPTKINCALWRNLQPQKEFHVIFPDSIEELREMQMAFDKEGLTWNSGRQFSTFDAWNDDLNHGLGYPVQLVINTLGRVVYSHDWSSANGHTRYHWKTFIQEWNKIRQLHDANALEIFKMQP